MPRGITALTGIDNEMVSDAPRFSDVADHLNTFLSGSIFVAHIQLSEKLNSVVHDSIAHIALAYIAFQH